MKRFLKTPLLLLLCLTLALSGALPVSAAIATSRKHVTPAIDKIETIYSIDQTNQTYHPVPRSEWNKVRTALSLSTTPSQNENKNSKYVGGFCFILADGVQRIYTISETQVLVGNIPLFASVAERAALEKLSRQLCKDNPAYPAMLAYMNPEKITRATLNGYGATNNKIDEGKPISMDITRAANQNAVLDFARRMKSLEVTPRATSIANVHRIPAATTETMHGSIEFSTGTEYTFSIDNGELAIYSSDGTRTYTYTFPDYDPRRPGVGEGWKLRADMWDLYRDGGNYTGAAIFLTKADSSRERTRGAFYSVDDGGLSTMTRLGQILDDIRTTTPLSRIQKSEKPFLEIQALNSYGELERFELDGDKQTAYYIDENGRGHSVPLSADDYTWVKSLLKGRERSNRTILMESGNGDELLYTCSSRDPLFGELFDPKPKDPDATPYTTGALPSYASHNAIRCWADNGNLTQTTVYSSGAMIQQSHLRPWTPATYDAKTLYATLYNLLRG